MTEIKQNAVLIVYHLSTLWALETLGEIHGTAYGLKFKYMGIKCCSRYKLYKRSL